MSRANRGALFWGAVLVLLGLVFLLNNFHIVPASLAQWWPVPLLGLGLLLFGRGLARRRGGALVTGTVLLALGGFWLLDNLGRIHPTAYGRGALSRADRVDGLDCIQAREQNCHADSALDS